ncbi:unnamed protein product, partial [Ixodes persulcatus]
MSWSRRPGRRMAGSMMSGRLVAPMMNTFFLLLMPSISVRIWLITRSAAPPANATSPTLPPRALAMESSSSKKSTQGAAALACRGETLCAPFRRNTQSQQRTLSKTSRTLASDSPNHMVSSSGPLMEMKLAWHSLAMALA